MPRGGFLAWAASHCTPRAADMQRHACAHPPALPPPAARTTRPLGTCLVVPGYKCVDATGGVGAVPWWRIPGA
eukprot:scaffold1594_cov401-Prasinococcus_capsulatus_cf.AAC.45